MRSDAMMTQSGTAGATRAARTLKRKLLLAVFLTSAVAWLVAALAIAGYEQWTFLGRAERELSQQAHLVALNLTAAVQFEDKDTAREILATVRDLPGMKSACAYEPSGQLFVGLALDPESACPPSASSEATEFSVVSGTASLTEPILSRGQNVGSLAIHVALPSFTSRLLQYGLALAIVFLALGFGSFLLRGVLQRLLVDPILALVSVARTIASHGELRARVELQSNDELGELGRAFNQMLDRLEEREQELHQHRQDLERLVVERTSELAAAKDAAEAATVAKSSFLANMSHEIRTPMNAIVGLTHLLRRASHDPEEQEKLRKISDAAQHLLSIINDILDISKIESGNLTLEETDFDLETLMNRVFTLVSDRAQAKGLEIIFDVDPAVPQSLRGDPMRFSQLILNFASNAVKFTEQGTIVFRARALEANGSSVLVRFEVQDTGLGIDPAQIPRVFESFQQSDSSTTRKYGGTGLGLAINRHLAALMGGEVGATSKLGVGSTFWFTARLQKSADRPMRKVGAHLRGARVLVTDDSKDAREILSGILASFGLRVAAAESGAEAVASVAAADGKGDPFDIIILDWRMPTLDGMETARRIGALELSRPPTYFMVTAYDEPDLKDEAARVGFAAVLTKPVTASALHDTLSTMAEGTSARGVALSQDSAAERALRQEHRGKRLLLAEDNLVNREVTLELLRDVGFSVDIAGNGAEAVAHARRRIYDAVLMDMQMPEMDGLEATRAIRELSGWSAVPIIAMTANAFGEDRAACLAAGMNDHLGKPATPADLFAILHTWLTKRAASEAGGSAPTSMPAADESDGRDMRDALPSLDVPRLMKQMKQNRVLVDRLLGLAAAELRKDGARLRDSAAQGDFTGAFKAAHSIKGTSGQIEAASLHALAGGAEVVWRRGAAVDAARFAALTASLDALVAELDRYLAAIGAGIDANGETTNAPR
ncbi:MAG TPA: response regulator [Stellaceae bacterium]|nr:response regulator [Stellaceae bacterium]